MRSTIVSTLARSGGALLLGLACLTAGCGSTDVLYVSGHSPVALSPHAENYQNPDDYRVDSSAYPSYVAKYNFSPPVSKNDGVATIIPYTEILTTDIWRVTHKVSNLLLVYSDSYQVRECEKVLAYDKFAGSFKEPFGGSCISRYLYCLYIFTDGQAVGWKRLVNPIRVALSKERYTIMDPASRTGPGWPEQPLFEPVR